MAVCICFICSQDIAMGAGGGGGGIEYSSSWIEGRILISLVKRLMTTW